MSCKSTFCHNCRVEILRAYPSGFFCLDIIIIRPSFRCFVFTPHLCSSHFFLEKRTHITQEKTNLHYLSLTNLFRSLQLIRFLPRRLFRHFIIVINPPIWCRMLWPNLNFFSFKPTNSNSRWSVKFVKVVNSKFEAKLEVDDFEFICHESFSDYTELSAKTNPYKTKKDQ